MRVAALAIRISVLDVYSGSPSPPRLLGILPFLTGVATGCDVLDDAFALQLVVRAVVPAWTVPFFAFAPYAHWRQSERLSSGPWTGADVIGFPLLYVQFP